MSENNTLNSAVTYAAEYGLTSSDSSLTYPDFDGWYRVYYWPAHTDNRPNPMETAFKIASKLLEKKIIQKISLKQFIELVGEISKLIY